MATTAVLLAALPGFAQKITWVTSFSEAQQKAKASGKLVMVEFYTDWDEWGKRLEAGTFTDAAVVKRTQNFIPVRINADRSGKAVADRYHVTNYPTVMFLDPEGGVAGVIDGYEDPSAFIKHTDVFVKDYKEIASVKAKAAKGDDLDAVARLGTIYADRYQIEPALVQLKRAEALDSNNGTDKLSDLYNAVGDYYQNRSDFVPAIRYFQKAADTSKSTDKRAYGYLSIAACYFTMYPPKLKEMIAPLEATLKLPNLKEDDRKLATDMLSMARRGMSDGGE